MKNEVVKNLEHGLEYVGSMAVKTKNIVEKLVMSVNEMGVHLSLVIDHLNEKAPGWDGGMLAQRKLFLEHVQKYHAVHSKISKSADLTPEAKCELADELWALSGRIEKADTAQDAALAVTLYMQAGNLTGAERVIRHLRDEDGKPVGKLTENNVTLIERRLEELKSKEVGQ